MITTRVSVFVNTSNPIGHSQCGTKEGLGGSEPLPLAFDLRNKRVRMRQNMVFSTKNTKHLLERGHSPFPRHFPQWRWVYPIPTPHPLGASGISTPHILKSWVRHCHWSLPSIGCKEHICKVPLFGTGASYHRYRQFLSVN